MFGVALAFRRFFAHPKNGGRSVSPPRTPQPRWLAGFHHSRTSVSRRNYPRSMTVSYPGSPENDPQLALKISGYSDEITASLDQPGHAYVNFDLSRDLDPYETHAAEDAGVEIDHYNRSTRVCVNSERLGESLNVLNRALSEVEAKGKLIRQTCEQAVNNLHHQLREIDFH